MLLPLQRSPSPSTNMEHIFTLLGPTRQLRHHQRVKETMNSQWQEVPLHPHRKPFSLPQPWKVQENYGDASSIMDILWITPTASLCLPDPWCSLTGGTLTIPSEVPVLPFMVGCAGTQTSKDWSPGHWQQRDVSYCKLLVPSQNETRLVFSQKDETRLSLFPERSSKICLFLERRDKTLNLWVIHY